MKGLTWNIKDNIGYLLLDQPPHNSLDNNFFMEWKNWLAGQKEWGALNGIIISGKGRHFSSGTDVEQMIDDQLENNIEQVRSYFRQNRKAFLQLKSFPFPVVAAMKGVCLGSAMELALSCDYRISTERTVMGFPEITFGVMPGLGGAVLLSRMTTKAKAARLLLSGETFGAKDALEMEIVQKIVPKKSLMTAAKDIICNIDKGRLAFYKQ